MEPSRTRKSVWLSVDEYNTLNRLKRQYEAQVGSTDWGKFLLFLAGIAIGAGITTALVSIAKPEEQSQK